MKKMKYLFIFLILTLLLCSCFSNDSNDKEEEKVNKIELFSTKTEITADNKDIAVLSIICYDINGNEIEAEIELYKDGEKYNEFEFKIGVEGEYIFIAKSGDILVMK